MFARATLAASALLVAALAGCALPGREPTRGATLAPPRLVDDAPPPPATQPAMARSAWLTDAEAPEPTHLAFPDGSPVEVISAAVPGRSPIVVGLHGSHMLPAWSCGFLWEAFRGGATVICPAGDQPTIRPGPERTHAYSWSGAHAAHARAIDAVALAYGRLGDRLDGRDPVLATYSQSSFLAPEILAEGGFHAALIWEGFSGPFAPRTARALPGGLRVALVPASPGHLASAEAEAAAFRRAGVIAQVAYAGDVGHGFAEETRAAMRRAVPALVSGLPSWN